MYRGSLLIVMISVGSMGCKTRGIVVVVHVIRVWIVSHIAITCSMARLGIVVIVRSAVLQRGVAIAICPLVMIGHGLECQLSQTTFRVSADLPGTKMISRPHCIAFRALVLATSVQSTILFVQEPMSSDWRFERRAIARLAWYQKP